MQKLTIAASAKFQDEILKWKKYFEEKNNIKGYIGAETFAELSFVVGKNIVSNENKEVWLLNIPSKEVKCYQEISNFIKLGWVKIFNEKELR